MKKETRNIMIALILVFGIWAGLAFAQTNNNAQPQQQRYGHMMGGGGMHGGMMGGNQGYWGGTGCGGMMGKMETLQGQ